MLIFFMMVSPPPHISTPLVPKKRSKLHFLSNFFDKPLAILRKIFPKKKWRIFFNFLLIRIIFKKRRGKLKISILKIILISKKLKNLLHFFLGKIFLRIAKGLSKKLLKKCNLLLFFGTRGVEICGGGETIIKKISILLVFTWWNYLPYFVQNGVVQIDKYFCPPLYMRLIIGL